jgi:hypothetical protein
VGDNPRNRIDEVVASVHATHTYKVRARAQEVLAFCDAKGQALDDTAGQIHDMDVLAVTGTVEGGNDELLCWVAGHVCLDEGWIGGEVPPGPADGAEAADVLGREANQDVGQQLLRQDAEVDSGGKITSLHRRMP